MSSWRAGLAAVAVAVSVTVLVQTGGPAAAAAVPRAVPDAEPLGVAECANDVNDRGLVVLDASMYRAGEVLPLPGGLTYGKRVNDAGQVLGNVGATAALWDGRRTVLVAPLPGDDYVYLSGLNERGDVVGTSGQFGGVSRAFLRAKGGAVTVLSAPGVSAGASSLNDLRQVVGYVDDAGTQQAVLWDTDGSVRALPSLAGAGGHTLAVDVNNRGDVVGYSYEGPATGLSHAVRWPRGGGPALSLDPDGGAFGVAVDVNEVGRVVGSVVPSGGAQQAFVRDGTGRTRLLAPAAPATSSIVTAVNDLGWVVGCALHDDVSDAFLWRP